VSVFTSAVFAPALDLQQGAPLAEALAQPALAGSAVVLTAAAAAVLEQVAADLVQPALAGSAVLLTTVVVAAVFEQVAAVFDLQQVLVVVFSAAALSAAALAACGH
jgi:uncharacterized membrane protein YkvI